MRLQIIHLSDMHFEKREDSFEIRIDKMIQAIDEPKRKLLGQCADGELLGEVKTGMVKRAAFPYPRGSQERSI